MPLPEVSLATKLKFNFVSKCGEWEHLSQVALSTGNTVLMSAQDRSASTLDQDQLSLEASFALHSLGRAEVDPDSIPQFKMMVKVNQHNIKQTD